MVLAWGCRLISAEQPARLKPPPQLADSWNMDSSTVIALLLIIAVAIQIAGGVRIVPDGHRRVVFRFGRVHRILEPGLRWVLPGLDRVRRIDLDAVVPSWKTLAAADLRSRLEHLAETGQLPPLTG